MSCFFFYDTATTEIYTYGHTLSLHDALPISSRKVEACQQVADAIVASGGSAQANALHIGDPAAIEALFAQLETDGRSPDILVNNAAANPYFGPMIDMDLATYEKTVEVNLRGYFWTCVQAARRMKAKRSEEHTSELQS